MNILFLSAWFPYPTINGAKIRIYNLIQQLAQRNKVDLLSFARTIPVEEAEKHVPFMKQFCNSVEVIGARRFTANGLASYRGFLSVKPRSIKQTYSPEMAQLVDKYISSNTYDVVVVSEVAEPGVASLIATDIRGIPKVLDAIEIGLVKDAYYKENSIIPRMRNGLTWFKLKRFTNDIIGQADACTVPSIQERQNLLEILPQYSPIEVIPHALDLSRFADSHGPPRPDKLTFTGSLTYYANEDAAYFFLSEIYPQIKASIPGVSAQLLGSTNGIELDEWPVDDSITFKGLIQDVRPEIARSWLSVVPLRIGAGTRLKIIESMALGVPVVSTKKGAEGLDVVSGVNIMLADDPYEFAQAAVELLRDHDLRQKISKEGQRLVKEKYSSEAMGRSFQDLLERVVN